MYSLFLETLKPYFDAYYSQKLISFLSRSLACSSFYKKWRALGTRLPKTYPHFVTVSLLYVVSFLMQLTVVMAFISSLLLNSQKCQRLFQVENTAFCIYFVDIILCVVIIALLVPQIVVVRT